MRQTPTIAENYPYGMSNSEIEKDIQAFSREINVNAGKPTVSACYAPLIQLGQSELQFRLAKKTFWIILSAVKGSVCPGSTVICPKQGCS